MKRCILFTLLLCAVLCWLRQPAAEDRALATLVAGRRAADNGRRSTLDEAEELLK